MIKLNKTSVMTFALVITIVAAALITAIKSQYIFVSLCLLVVITTAALMVRDFKIASLKAIGQFFGGVLAAGIIIIGVSFLAN